MRTGPVAFRRRSSLAAFWRRRLAPWRTRRLLEVHLLVLTLCAIVGASALLGCYRQTQHGVEALSSREAPAVQGLAAARLAALRADWEVRVLVTNHLVDVAGAGKSYRSQLSAADQGLSRIADRTDQDLGTVNGLLAAYGNSLNLGMSMGRDQQLMQEQKFDEATSLLTRKDVGLAPRLSSLQRIQMTHAEATASLGRWQRGGWWLAELTLGALALTLLSALFVLRDRCGRDWNPYLLAAFVITVLLAVVPLMTTFSTERDLDDSIRGLGTINDMSQQDCCDDTLPGTQRQVTETSEEVRRELSDGAWTDRVYRGTLIGGLLLIALPASGLVLRLDSDYWRRR